MPISGQNIMFPPFFAGDGKDGAIITPSTGLASIDQSYMFETLCLTTSGGLFSTNGHKLFVKGLLRISASAGLTANGVDANVITGGAGAVTAELGGGTDGGNAAEGGNPATSANNSVSFASLGGSGGTGDVAGGQARWNTSLGTQGIWLRNFQAMYSGLLHYLDTTNPAEVVSTPVIISGGGGGGPGGAVNPATSWGGAGGGGGGIIWVAADTIWMENDSIISASGGAGANATGTVSSADGGSGGGAGAVILFCNHFIQEGTAVIQALGGASGTGVMGGGNGNPGANGNIVVFTPKEIITATGTLSS